MRGQLYGIDSIIIWVNNLLLEQHGTEAGVESTSTLVLQDLAEAASETASEGGLGDETDTGGLQRAEGNVGEELGSSGRGEVDRGSVLRGRLVAELVDALLLEEFVTTELEGTLEEVPGSGGTETGEKSASTLVGNDLSETTDHTLVVGDRVQLDSSLDAVCMLDRFFSHHNSRALHKTTTQHNNKNNQNHDHHRNTYTSTGVRAPWVTEQQTAPAKANLP